MERFGSRARKTRPTEALALASSGSVTLSGPAVLGKLCALGLTGICYGLVNFGLLLWLPAELVARGEGSLVASLFTYKWAATRFRNPEVCL